MSPPEGPHAVASPRHAGWHELLTRRHLPQLLVLCLAIWLHAANSMLTATTLPGAVGDIGGLRLISWAFALYLIGSIVAATSISVWVVGHGLRRTMMAATLVYTLGCVICAAAPSMPVLLVGRTVQGLGGGALVALVYIAQDRFFPNRLVPRIVACLSVRRTTRCGRGGWRSEGPSLTKRRSAGGDKTPPAGQPGRFRRMTRACARLAMPAAG